MSTFFHSCFGIRNEIFCSHTFASSEVTLIVC